MMTFVVNIEIRPESFEEAREMLAATPEVVTLVQTNGSCHLMAICVCEDVKTIGAGGSYQYLGDIQRSATACGIYPGPGLSGNQQGNASAAP